MPQADIQQAAASNLTDRVEVVTVDTKALDVASDHGETEWLNPKWGQYWGYFNELPDLKSAILMKAAWITGKGYTTDSRTQVILNRIKGWGKDTFEDVIFNANVISMINGDSFTEIVRNPDDGNLLNLKPLDPSTMMIVTNRQGIIIRYEQIDRTEGNTNKKFKVNDVLHISLNRLASQIHGISIIEALEKTILADNESFVDIQKIMHRQARPMIMFRIGTDNATKIAAFIKKMDDAVNKGENIYIPADQDSVDFEVIQVNVGSILFDWRNDLRNKFYRTIGLPQIVPGAGGQSTESESKAIYFAFEQLVQMDQRTFERQLEEQLAVKIDLVPPTTLAQSLQTDEAKDASQQTTIAQPSDTTAGVGR